jgi:predicted glycosyltransferase
MLREAAFLGVPAYSIFRGNIGAVDRYLASIDRLTLVSSPADFADIDLTQRNLISPLRRTTGVADGVATMILDRVESPTVGSRARTLDHVKMAIGARGQNQSGGRHR